MWKCLSCRHFNQERVLVGAFSVIVKSSRSFIARSNNVLLSWFLMIDNMISPAPTPDYWSSGHHNQDVFRYSFNNMNLCLCLDNNMLICRYVDTLKYIYPVNIEFNWNLFKMEIYLCIFADKIKHFCRNASKIFSVNILKV